MILIQHKWLIYWVLILIKGIEHRHTKVRTLFLVSCTVHKYVLTTKNKRILANKNKEIIYGTKQPWHTSQIKQWALSRQPTAHPPIENTQSFCQCSFSRLYIICIFLPSRQPQEKSDDIEANYSSIPLYLIVFRGIRNALQWW